ncbi:isoprenylcysteine carboxylmethyltransferase family protein [Bradyrhizobium diazoefficiens]|nr:isoprenylcysteine carboxylmethyltransferase family protein [Bradyrhizobium diazoefficiens]UCF54289.1 MAG: isoprenylcysteine carboxylmethyltransferase family protein [Bradyrhizobium sp.]MBR0963631.1 isoprenylcysteine carboxylmethyltransferase family protein [Bradyrhizobium diazoefficiens]MBR0977783.1 isoprenylcysteine carboxylmethyltransferase family protein [Bradyrhizobium diazoefficiens]MBR1007293.1 isoprenylcysteine carboxylmethyltransferase family protein [Bradyrhizobium diazoefficiens]M
MSETSLDRPDVMVFPPVIPLGTLVVAGVLQWLLPIGMLASAGSPLRLTAGIILMLAGLLTVSAGRRALQRGKTNISPSLPATALVTDGVFAYTRNPLYVGGTFAMCGIALLFDLDWMLLLMLPACVLLHFAVVLPEEHYLAQKFGGDYRRYCTNVPRYFYRH